MAERESGDPGERDDEESLWHRETEGVRPLADREKRRPAQRPRATSPPGAIVDPRAPTHVPAQPEDLSRLDAGTRSRLRKGKLQIEDTLDLHGMTREAAQRAVTAFVSDAAAAGRRCLLIISGRGSATGLEGVLRSLLPGWLRAPRLDPLVLAYCAARPAHGGTGALYVLLRRNRGALR